jgi:DNA invertase Pin-like site-specific DNA recombinase
MDNSNDAKRKGRLAFGDRNGSRRFPERLVRGEQQHLAKITSEDAAQIRAEYAAGGISQEKLAEKFGISQPTTSSIIRREIWRHVP